MRGELQLGPIGQIARAVKDIEQAEAWYRDILGLTHMYTYGKLAFFDCGGTRLMVEERTIIDVPNLHNDSVLYFRVADINAAHDELHSRGVSFRGAPHMIFKHPDGTEEWMAFFEDMDGGLLALMSEVRPIESCHSEPFGFAQDRLREESRRPQRTKRRRFFVAALLRTTGWRLRPQDHLAELVAAAQVAVRRRRLGEREDAVDHGLELARRDEVENLRQVGG